MRVAVKLQHGDFEDSFEADALNVSKGGISMRAPCLPDLHSRLTCRFQCMPSGASVTAQGEVVWAHLDGEHSGEFGLAFVDLDPKTEWLIEEMIAEHAAVHRELEPAAPVARLELEGSSEPIEARMAHREGDTAVFEQELDLLSLGRGVLAHAPGAEGRAGSIAAVELRMVGSVPMLAVTVAFEERGDAREFSFGAGEAVEPDHDTEPDLEAPPQLASGASEPKSRSQVTITEFGSRAHAQYDESDEGTSDERLQQASDEADVDPDADTDADAEAPRQAPAWSVSPLDPRSLPVAREEPAAATRARDFSHAFKVDEADDDDLDAEIAAFSEPGLRSVLAPALRLSSALFTGLARVLGATGASAAHKALPKLRGMMLRCGGVVRSLYGRRLATQLGATRRLATGVLLPKRRRTTTGPATAKKAEPSGSLGRTVLLGVLSAGAAGLAVYALAPSGHSDRVDLGRHVQPAQEPVDMTFEPGAAPATPPSPSPDPASEARSAPAASALPAAAQPAQPAQVPAPARANAASAARPTMAASQSVEGVAPSSPFAVDVRSNSAAKPEPTPAPTPAPARSLRFGANKVPHGHRFTLRMSTRIQSLQGTADKGGFTLNIAGVLSLDRAGPISSAIKSVKHAMIVNHGDHAELSIRFADDRQPAYQAIAEGNTLVLVIED
jgi:hypothetical protein